MRRSILAFVLASPATVLLGGCDMLGIDTPEKIAASREADGKAIGSACRHAGRAIEDCFAIYKKADRSAVFAGWRDMNDYMRENKIDAVAPQILAKGDKPAAESKPKPSPEVPVADKKPTKAAGAKPKAHE